MLLESSGCSMGLKVILYFMVLAFIFIGFLILFYPWFACISVSIAKLNPAAIKTQYILGILTYFSGSWVKLALGFF